MSHCMTLNPTSHLRTAFTLSGLNVAPLQHQQVTNALRALSVTLRHVPDQKDGAGPNVLRLALAHAGTFDYPIHVAAAVLIMFHGFFRQSNVAAMSRTTFDPTRQFTRSDFNLDAGTLIVSVKWSKTLQASGTPSAVPLASTLDPLLCPVRAYSKLLEVDPTRVPHQPFLQFKDGNPMTVRYLSNSWQDLLRRAGLNTKTYSLHSLRKGGALHAHSHGANLPDIMAQGTWASDSVHGYLRPAPGTQTTVHRAMQIA